MFPKVICLLMLLGLILVGCEEAAPPDHQSSNTSVSESVEQPEKKVSYVGSPTCARCHENEQQQWSDSHHDQAMQLATTKTVLGNFNNAPFEYYGIRSTFTKKDEKFFVQTDGPNGELADFEITHTFGIDPLQQYLVTFPDGRLQALSIAWDSRSKEEGGQRWFHLYPNENITHDDPLHWTKRNQTWNYMCADCHSTNVRKNFALQDNRYTTTWSDINVGCEACHGPGSNHIRWADTNQAGQDSPGTDGQYGFSHALTTATDEINTCARCHARRSILAEGYLPGRNFYDFYRPALLEDGLYHADGQILDEVYVYGSFLQSKMYQKGVRCTDCHHPHTTRLKTSGNATCTRCHQSQPPSRFPTLQAKNYDSSAHHFHPTGSSGSTCSACHMPSKNYMVIDERHDHSFRIPRPDLSIELGTPNACNSCHAKQSFQWAADHIADWYKHKPLPHFAKFFDAGRQGKLLAETPLTALSLDHETPEIIRATSMSLLQRYGKPISKDAITAGLHDNSPLIRLASLRGAERLLPETRWQLTHHLLTDSVHVVKIEAARILAVVDPASLSLAQKGLLDSALSEYITTQRLNADRPEAHTNLGLIYSQTRKFAKAQHAYEKALRLDPQWIPALVNLADLYRVQGRDAEGEQFIKRGLDSEPNNADLHHAYGLWLTRQNRLPEAIDALNQATKLAPDISRYAYVYGIALNSTGQVSEARQVLGAAQAKFPENIDILYALVTIHRDRGDTVGALGYAKRLATLRPDQEYFSQLVNELQTPPTSR